MNYQFQKMRSLITLSAALVSGAVGATEPPAPPSPGVIIRLWDGPAPNAPKTAVEETTDKDGRVKNVSVPKLTAYLPDKAVATGTAIIVCSGGGYSQLAVKKHGEGAAAAFLPRGIAVFALKYRLQPISKNIVADACADGERALRLVRSRAGEWNLDPQRIGIIGYSAGANLILNLLANSDDGAPGSDDAIERQSSRPNFAGLFSAWDGGQKIADFKISKKWPPVYIAHTEDDTTARIAFAREIEAGLKQAGVPVKTDYFDKGGHQAFTIAHGLHGDWPVRFVPWLEKERLVVLKSSTKP